jgi:hypothetical protein
MKSVSQINIFSLIVIAALLTIAKMWKQPKCLLTDENAKKKKILQGWGIVQVVKPLPSNGKAPSSIRRTTINKR